MRFAWLSLVKDLRRLKRDPLALLVWIGVPVFIAILLSVLFGRGGSPAPSGRLLLVDEDKSLAATLLAGAFQQGELGKMIQVEKVGEREGRRRISQGDASALLVIPKGFGDALLKGESSVLKLVTNPSQRILPDIIRQVVEMLLEAGFYVQKLAPDSLRRLVAGKAPSDESIAEISIAMNRIGKRVGAYLDPLRIELETRVKDEPAKTQVSFTTLMLPGMLFMAVLFVAGGLAGDLWRERARGTLRRAAATPSKIESFLAGKVLSAAVVIFVLGIAAIVSGRLLLDMQASHAGIAVVWVAFSGAALYLLLAVLELLPTNERGGHLLANMIMLPLSMLGGGLFPFEAMPPWMARIGRLTPNGWAVVELRAMLEGRVKAEALGAAFAGLVIFSAICFWIVARRLRRGLAS